MINHNGSTLLSVLIGLPSVIGIVIACVILAIGCTKKAHRDNEGEFFVGTVFFIVVAMVFTIASIFGYYPYGGDYHKLQPATGTVKAVDSRFLATSEYVVVTYDTGLVVRCDDSRCSTIRPGDAVTLLCTKQHEWGSPLRTDGWACRWGQ